MNQSLCPNALEFGGKTSMTETVAIRTENLSKTFGRGDKAVEAVKNLDLSVESGQVYGFLGPNGAGKSTTIRMLVDLVRPTTGEAFLFGENVREHRDGLKRVSAMVENPSFYGFLSARDNLEVLARSANDFNPSRIDQVLEQAGLADDADRRLTEFSTGMKQRLGVASALLGDPDLIVLDEPTNGLDPIGIQEMRGLIRGLVEDHKKTVFLSSHILHEVEQVCDRVAIINNGVRVQEGAVTELLGRSHQGLRLLAAPIDNAVSNLREKWAVIIENDWLVVSASPEEAAEIVQRLVDVDVEVHQVVAKQRTLEELFMEATDSQKGEVD
jgi:ABC-2 type transport system ATP-binding protein